MRSAWVVVFVASTAVADDTPVNLTASVPTTIAVSSTVDNASIKPEHIADGRLDTAWNSRTGDLTPHIYVRVPPTAKVTSIKMTAGFTKVDKRLGDLFTMNPRIRKVRISSGGHATEHHLDFQYRGLQELKVDLPAGDLDIAILARVPGTKKSWKEISISELEVWGTTTAKPKPQKPSIRLVSLDALPALTKAECRKVVGALEGKVVSTTELGVTRDMTLCRIDTDRAGDDSRVTLQLAAKKTRRALGAKLEIDLTNGAVEESEFQQEHEVEQGVSLALVPLRTTEHALSVSVKRGTFSNFHAYSETTTTLYRMTEAGFEKLVAWETVLSDAMESNDATKCEGPRIKPTASMPKKLTVRCIDYKSDWHNDDLSKRGMHETASKKTYVWNGASYDEE